jgi:outer membrane lipoprotein-sorting protein
MKKLWFVLFALLPGWALAAPAPPRPPTPRPVVLDAAARADIARIEDYWRAITTMRADFTQIAPDETVSYGRFYLQRPGRLRFEYDPPVPLLLVGRRGTLTMIDYDLRQVTRWPVKETPLKFLLGRSLNLTRDAVITRLDRGTDRLSITLMTSRDARDGFITLVFSYAPFQLRYWEVTDSQGLVTRISFTNLVINRPLDEALFTYKDPRPEVHRRKR